MPANILRFAEMAFEKPGKRRFGVRIEDDEDLPETYEPPLARADEKRHEVDVTDGRLDIAFVRGKVNNPKISAIEVICIRP